jgi:two-component system NtrC family response regulator
MSDLPKLLIVEDDEAIRTQLKYALRERYALSFAGNRVDALAVVEEIGPDVVSLDLGLPPQAETAEEGLRTLEDILRAAPNTKVVVLTGSGDRLNARRAIALGAFDYLAKSANLGEYEMVLRRSCYLQTIESENAQQSAEAEANARFEEIIGSTPRMREIFSMVSLVAKTDVTVLVQGESGTGKELVARAVHGKSRRKNAPFVAINCGAIPETLLESELFGHEKGAYTGAHVQRKGKLELADGGTVFLDEVAEMPLSIQVKLLRFLQERKVERLGGRQAIPVDVRVIAASNKDLKDEIAAGGFREDLYFRLSVVTITLPPLRERAEDIGMLANAFLRRAAQEYRRKLRFSREAIAAVAKYQWPGNIRELENSIQRASIMARGRFIEPVDLGIPSAGLPEHVSLREARNRVERQVVVDALTRTRGNISRAATELGVSRPTLHSLLEKHGIDSRELRPARAIG